MLEGDFLGFGGMDNIRFRGPVFPNCRLILAARVSKLRTRRAEFDFQAFVKDEMVVSGSMIGVPITRDQRPE
jgi:3-hydroxyacyl-[acyl-carrier-protein] dehydratase